MKKFGSCFLVFICVLSVAICDTGDVQVSLPPEPITLPPITNPPPTTSPPSPKPPTTSPPSPKPPTTSPPSPKPPTTSPPSPKPPTTSPPSPKPTTTSPPSPKPTTPSPSPPPNPEPPKPIEPTTGTWFINVTGSNVTCLLVEAAIQIQVPYYTMDNRTFQAYVDVPNNAISSGECTQDDQVLTLSWMESNDTVLLSFVKNDTKYFLNRIEITLTPDVGNFPNAKEYNETIRLVHNQVEFETSIDKSYKCVKQQDLNLTDISSKDVATLHVSNFRFEAFHNSTNHEFTTAEDCAAFDTPDIVPIAVGCALAALVLIVLVAYLIGRRRRQARGYLSM